MRTELTKEKMDTILKELARQYRKLAGRNARAEIILVGGASILMQYTFRNSTTDVDAFIIADSCMKEAIQHTAEIYQLDDDWLNEDFRYTASYSPKIIEHSLYYKTFAHVLEVRVISPAYLIAMKIRAAREYKNDLSDIVGILQNNNDISLEDIREAYKDMYNTSTFPDSSNAIIELLYKDIDLQQLYNNIRHEEIQNRQLITSLDHSQPALLKAKSPSRIIEEHKQKE